MAETNKPTETFLEEMHWRGFFQQCTAGCRAVGGYFQNAQRCTHPPVRVALSPLGVLGVRGILRVGVVAAA